MSTVGTNAQASASTSAAKAKADSASRLTRANPEQVARLESEYSRNSHPPVAERRRIAAEVGRPLQSVSNWFANRRRRDENAKGQQSPSITTPSSSIPPSASPWKTDPHFIHPEEPILFQDIMPAIALLHQLYLGDPAVSSDKADAWASALDFEHMNARAGIIHKWLTWRRALEADEFKKNNPQDATRSPRARNGSSHPYLMTPESHSGRLPTPSSTSPPARNTHLKEEPTSPQRPQPAPLRPVESTPLVFGDPGILRKDPATNLSASRGSSVSVENTFATDVFDQVDSGPLPSLHDFVHLRYPTREDFNNCLSLRPPSFTGQHGLPSALSRISRDATVALDVLESLRRSNTPVNTLHS